MSALIDRGWNEGDLSVIDELVHPDYVRHTPWGDMVGPKAWEERIVATRAAFENFRTDVHDTVVEGEVLASRFTVRGIHRLEVRGFLPTGKLVEFDGMVFARVEADQLVEEWELVDTASLLAQLAGNVDTSR